MFHIFDVADRHFATLVVLIVHKYEESNVDFNLFLNCCKIGNCVISFARPFYMCIPLTVIDSSLWVLFAFVT